MISEHSIGDCIADFAVQIGASCLPLRILKIKSAYALGYLAVLSAVHRAINSFKRSVSNGEISN